MFTYTWRDQGGRQYSRTGGDTLVEAEAFERCIDDQLGLGSYRPVSTTTFATYATAWIEVAALKEQTRAPTCRRSSAATSLSRSTRTWSGPS